MADMSKIVLGRFVSYLVTLLIGFFVARQMLSADVAAKLMRGDTIELWGGSWTVSLKQIVDFLVNCWPVILPLGLAIRGRIIEKYKLIVARLSPAKLTDAEVKEKVAGTPLPQIISTIAAKP
jgi:hypothetical protein